MSERPWETGSTQSERWAGYFQPGFDPADPTTHVLRNKIGATLAAPLHYVEGSITRSREFGLVERPVEPATFDLEHLRTIHHRLFDEIYPWAGEIRTVGMSKGGVQFTPQDRIADTVDSVGRFLATNGYFRGGSQIDVVSALSVGYDLVNQAHPFREGNGRTQRIFWDDFTRGTGHYIDWERIRGTQNDVASHKARMGNNDALTAMFVKVVHPLEDRVSIAEAFEGRRATLQALADRRSHGAIGLPVPKSPAFPYEPPGRRDSRPGIQR